MMKNRFNFFMYAIWILLCLFTTGCQDDELLELNLNDEKSIIEYEVNGINLNFCLLNEQGDSATTFREGENFVFRFQIDNQTEEFLDFYDWGFYTQKDFFSVKSNRENNGKPFKFLRNTSTKEAKFIFPGGTKTFQVPWQEERNEFQMMYGYFKGLSQPNLKKGKYYTEFTYNFTFGSIETGKLTFKINFEIN